MSDKVRVRLDGGKPVEYKTDRGYAINLPVKVPACEMTRMAFE